MSTKVFEILWLSGDAKGYTDVFPSDVFGSDSNDDLRHDVRGPDGGLYNTARCRMEAEGSRVDLDYEAHQSFNKAHGMSIGVMRLQFADADRTSLDAMFWKDSGAGIFEKIETKISEVPAPLSSSYAGPGDNAERVLRMVRERPGQMNFRRKLKDVYGHRCCLTGCGVAEVLDAAHIDPYVGPSSDHPQNGLLLRRDLHALFDAGLLAIEPESRVAYFAPETHEWPEYRAMHGMSFVRTPDDAYEDRSACQHALRRRWDLFNSTYRGR